MEPAGLMFLSGGIVAAGTWLDGKKLDPKVIIGSVVTAGFVAMIGEVSPDLASKFAGLILLFVLFAYGPAVLHKLGLIPDKSYALIKDWAKA